jgi:hypothetical protein
MTTKTPPVVHPTYLDAKGIAAVKAEAAKLRAFIKGKRIERERRDGVVQMYFDVISKARKA